MTETEIIEEFQQRKRELRPVWNRHILTGLPGFAAFVLGSEVWTSNALVIVGFLWVAFWTVRGFLILRRELCCPACGDSVETDIRFPYRSCDNCGARLSHGWKDS